MKRSGGKSKAPIGVMGFAGKMNRSHEWGGSYHPNQKKAFENDQAG